jgi:regulatory protein
VLRLPFIGAHGFFDSSFSQKFMHFKKTISEEAAFQKIKQYCAYQERCHTEVKEKLYSYGLYKSQVETIVSKLIEENYLNEERFAIQFAGGKFRMKQWGRKKIAYELGKKRVSSFCIKLALRQIDEADYEATLARQAATKWDSLKGQHHLTRLAKATAYLLQKGFEPPLVQQHLQRLKSKEK